MQDSQSGKDGKTLQFKLSPQFQVREGLDRCCGITSLLVRPVSIELKVPMVATEAGNQNLFTYGLHFFSDLMEHAHKAAIQDAKEAPESVAARCAAQEISVAQKIDMRALIAVASQIARRGYGESIIELAMRRKGVSREVARLIAASVVSCNATILASEGNARFDKQPFASVSDVDLRTARAARMALSRIMSFFVFIIAGVCGGAFIGWNIGFSQGLNDGFDWIVRAMERLM